MVPPQVLLDLDRMPLAQHPGRHTLQRVHQPSEPHGRRKLNQQVDVIVLAVELHQGDPEVVTRFTHGPFAGCEHGTSEHPTSVLGYEHQVSMTSPNSVSASAYIWLYSYNTDTTRRYTGE